MNVDFNIMGGPAGGGGPPSVEERLNALEAKCASLSEANRMLAGKIALLEQQRATIFLIAVNSYIAFLSLPYEITSKDPDFNSALSELKKAVHKLFDEVDS